MERMAEDLSRNLRGWIGYFGKCETPSVLAGIEQLLRRRLRSGDLEAVEARHGTVCRVTANGAWRRPGRSKRLVGASDRGGWRTRRRSASRCPMLTSTRLGVRD